MGKKGVINKISLTSLHIQNLKTFIKKIIKLKQVERVSYFNKIKKSELDLIREIVTNFLNGNVKYDTNSFNLLKRVRDII